MIKREVKVRSQGLINRLVIFEHILDDIMRLMNRVPSAVGIRMLHSQG